MPRESLFQFISAFLQVAVVFAITSAIWLVATRRKSSFASYVGLTRVPMGAIVFGASVGTAFASMFLLWPPARDLAAGSDTVVGSALSQMPAGWQIPVLLVLAVFKTALSEELLFRGLIGKRLIFHLGFALGNALQAILFGAVHLFIFWLAQPQLFLLAALFVVLISGMGWINGWMNEKHRGSILPGWAAHASANTVAYLVVAASSS